MKDIIIFDTKIAKSLVEDGFYIKNINVNKQNRDRVVFYFRRSRTLEDILRNQYNLRV